jgi:hypothetical protein
MNYASPLSAVVALTYGLAGLVGILALMACWMIAIRLTNRWLLGKARSADAASDSPAADSGPIAGRT